MTKRDLSHIYCFVIACENHAIHHTDRINKKNHTTVSISTEKVCDKKQLLIKTLNEEHRRTYSVKNILKRPIANIVLTDDKHQFMLMR